MNKQGKAGLLTRLGVIIVLFDTSIFRTVSSTLQSNYPRGLPRGFNIAIRACTSDMEERNWGTVRIGWEGTRTRWDKVREASGRFHEKFMVFHYGGIIIVGSPNRWIQRLKILFQTRLYAIISIIPSKIFVMIIIMVSMDKVFNEPHRELIFFFFFENLPSYRETWQRAK